jgi:ATP/ADP translocase/HEAT repeat protein
MAKNRLRSALSFVVDLKPGEEVIAVFLFLYFFFITSPYYIIKSLRNASYLSKLGDEKLPLAYFLTAVLMGFIVTFHSRLQVRLPRSRLIIFSLAFFFSNIILFWWLFIQGWKWVPVAFWVWANIFAIVLVTQFWILVNDVFNPREAKRMIGFIGSGAQLGAILGGTLAGVLASRAPRLLLPLAAGMLGLGTLVVSGIFRWQRQKTENIDSEARNREAASTKVGFRDAFETTRQSPYLLILGGIMMATLVVSTLIDWQFNSIVSTSYKGENKLISFYGYFNAGSMFFAFLFQLLLTTPIIKAFRIRGALLLYPLILFLGTGGIGMAALAGVIPILPAILIKASDKSLAYSLNQSVRELLYIPISPEQKYKSKIFIDMFLNRFAKGLGAVILAVLLWLVPKTAGTQGWEGAARYISISLIVLIIIAVWVFLNFRVGREYANLVKGKLKKQYERGDLLVDQRLDVDYTKRVFDTLESKNRSSVLYAMNLFDLIRQDRLTPEVRKLISYRADEIRAASLGGMFEQTETGLGPKTEDELSEDVLKKEVQEIMNLDVYQDVIKDYLEKTLADKSPGTEVARMEAAKAIGFMDSRAPLVKKLEDLLEDESPDVSRYAIQSAGALKRRVDVPVLVRKLKSPALREDAIDALRKFGPRIAGTMADYLADRSEEIELRKTAAAVLAAMGTQEAADLLSWELPAAGDALADEIIDALDRIRSSDSRIRFSEEIIKPRISQETRLYCRNLVDLHGGDKLPEETDRPREKKLADSLWNIFKLLGLMYPQEDMIKAYQNLKAGTKDSTAYSLELLDNVLEREIRDVVFPVVEDLSLEEKVKRCRNLLAGFEEGKDRNGRD